MLKFYRCNHCGNIIIKLHDSKVPVMCCGEAMTELTINSTDAAVEKHVPVVEHNNQMVMVTVGETLHPMTEEHYIEWIVLETKKGTQIQYLTCNFEPKATFVLTEDDELINVYAYCNLHGLWVKKVNEK